MCRHVSLCVTIPDSALLEGSRVPLKVCVVTGGRAAVAVTVADPE